MAPFILMVSLQMDEWTKRCANSADETVITQRERERERGERRAGDRQTVREAERQRACAQRKMHTSVAVVIDNHLPK